MLRTCLRCGAEMEEGYGLKEEFDVLPIKLAKRDKILSIKKGEVKAALCPNCGEISFYLEDDSKSADYKNPKNK